MGRNRVDGQLTVRVYLKSPRLTLQVHSGRVGNSIHMSGLSGVYNKNGPQKTSQLWLGERRVDGNNSVSTEWVVPLLVSDIALIGSHQTARPATVLVTDTTEWVASLLVSDIAIIGSHQTARPATVLVTDTTEWVVSLLVSDITFIGSHQTVRLAAVLVTVTIAWVVSTERVFSLLVSDIVFTYISDSTYTFFTNQNLYTSKSEVSDHQMIKFVYSDGLWLSGRPRPSLCCVTALSVYINLCKNIKARSYTPTVGFSIGELNRLLRVALAQHCHRRTVVLEVS
ncbi:hypothetical protein J6590_019677 [Homalodisca vitripennis]|nr:hypothetical protein J6590_019677 [Homalodisca vitripennis]